MSALDDTAFRVADRLRTELPWDVFAERSRRYELHLNGRAVEMARGPISVGGFGVRVFRARGEKTGVGFQASTDLSEEGVRTGFKVASDVARSSEFPAKRVELPTSGKSGPPQVEVRDARLWDRPGESLQDYVDTLFAAFDGKKGVTPSFGSVRATLTETSLANSAGLRTSYAHTTVEFEVAVKAFGGPEGAPPGEYWVNSSSRRLETDPLPGLVEEWCRFARDVRRAQPTPSGDLPVVLSSATLSGILPLVLGFRFTGGARLREIAPKAGDRLAGPALTIHDDGLLPWAIASAPVDDEGTRQRKRSLIVRGAVSELMYDALHAGAFGTTSTGNAVRISLFFRDWRHFLHAPNGTATTLVVEPGAGGTDAELIEAAGDGVWVQQLGWAIPDPISTAFGGELRIGYRIRGGKLAEPIRGGTVGGLVLAPPGARSLLNDVAAIGSRPTLSDTISTPTLLVRPLTVAGS
jgi:predicted Zn-dependent protease